MLSQILLILGGIFMSLSLWPTSANGTQVTNQSRFLDHSLHTFGMEIFMEAQAMESKLRGATRTVSLDGGKTKSFPILESLEYSLRTGGMQKTSYTSIGTDRREMRYCSHDVATGWDLEDIMHTDIRQDTATIQNLKASKGRIVDNQIIRAVGDPVLLVSGSNQYTSVVNNAVTTAPDSLGKEYGSFAGVGQTISNLAPQLRYKNNLYVTLNVASGAIDDDADSPLGAFDVKTINDLRYLYQSRDIPDIPVVAMTPLIERTLRNLEEFRDNQRVHKIGGDLESFEGAFYWMGFYWIRVSPSIVPGINFTNLLLASASGDFQVHARGLNLSTVVIAPEIFASTSNGGSSGTSSAAATKAGAYVVTGSSLNLLSQNILYSWIPRAMYFTTDGLNVMFQDRLPEHRHAQSIYSVFSAKGMLIQEDFSVMYLMKADGIKIKFKGTGAATKRG